MRATLTRFSTEQRSLVREAAVGSAREALGKRLQIAIGGSRVGSLYAESHFASKPSIQRVAPLTAAMVS